MGSTIGCSRTVVHQQWGVQCPAASLLERVQRSIEEKWSWRNVPSPPQRTWAKTPGLTCSTSVTGSYQMVCFVFFLLNHVQKLTCSRLHISNLIHTCILQNWPKKPTLQTIPELALSSSTSHRQTVFKIISLKYTFFPPFKSHNLTLLFFFFHKFSAWEKEKQLPESCKLTLPVKW